MLRYIKGTLEFVSEDFLILESGGLGYQINVPLSVLDKLPQIGDMLKIYTHLSIKEDGITLAGFLSMEEQQIFNRLITVSGVGHKAALNILSSLTPEQIALAIISDDVSTLCRAVGVGKKIAQRIILELKDRVKSQEAFVGDSSSQQSFELNVISKQEACDALVALGYDRSQAVNCIMSCYVENMTTSDLIRSALKKLY